ncbi:MAG: hypothetical protein IPG81_14945 [Sandaracinaceae bacterium]|nr:hypothetical protein [Sandaracinaceae bacterium]
MDVVRSCAVGHADDELQVAKDPPRRRRPGFEEHRASSGHGGQRGTEPLERARNDGGWDVARLIGGGRRHVNRHGGFTDLSDRGALVTDRTLSSRPGHRRRAVLEKRSMTASKR